MRFAFEFSSKSVGAEYLQIAQKLIFRKPVSEIRPVNIYITGCRLNVSVNQCFFDLIGKSRTCL